MQNVIVAFILEMKKWLQQTVFIVFTKLLPIKRSQSKIHLVYMGNKFIKNMVYNNRILYLVVMRIVKSPVKMQNRTWLYTS